MIAKMLVVAAEEQTWKSGEYQVLTLLDQSPVICKQLFEMAIKKDNAKAETATLPGTSVDVAITEFESRNGKAVLRGEYSPAKSQALPTKPGEK